MTSDKAPFQEKIVNDFSYFPRKTFCVIFGLPGPHFPLTCRSKAVLTALLECSTCPYQWSLLCLRMRSRSLMPSHASSSLDLVVTMSCGLTLEICLVIILSFCSRRWGIGFVTGQVSPAWSTEHHTQELYTWPRVLKERWQEERTGSSSLNFFQAVFTHVVIHGYQLLRACLLVAKGSYHLQLDRYNWDFPLWSASQGACSSLAQCTSVIRVLCQA